MLAFRLRRSDGGATLRGDYVLRGGDSLVHDLEAALVTDAFDSTDDTATLEASDTVIVGVEA